MRLLTPLFFLFLTILASCAGQGSGGPGSLQNDVGQENYSIPNVESFEDVGALFETEGDGTQSEEDLENLTAQTNAGGPVLPNLLGNGYLLPFLEAAHFERLTADLLFWFNQQPNTLRPIGSPGSDPRLEITPSDKLAVLAMPIGMNKTFPFAVVNKGGRPVDVRVESPPSAPFHLVWFKCGSIFCRGAISFAPTAQRKYTGRLVLRYKEPGAQVSNTIALNMTGRGYYRKIAATPGEGGGPHLKILHQGLPGERFFKDQFIGDSSHRGGLGSVAFGDMNGDHVPDIFVGSGVGQLNMVTIIDGFTNKPIRQIPVLGTSPRSGVRVATGFVNGDHQIDFAVATGPGARSRVQVFDGKTTAVLKDLYPYGGATVGAYVALADITLDGWADVVVGPGHGGGPILHGFDVRNNRVLFHRIVGNAGLRNGLDVQDLDLWKSRAPELLLSPGDGRVIVANVTPNGNLVLRREVRPFGGFNGMIHVGASYFDFNDATPELVLSAGKGGGPRMQVLHVLKDLIRFDDFVYGSGFRGGVQASGM